MPITDDLNHYASIVSWKVKQQTQILRVQAQIHDLVSQISIQKTILGERAYELFSQGSISGTNLAAEEPIRQTCEKISALIAEKAERQQELSLLRAQTPPEKSEAPTAPEAAAPAQAEDVSEPLAPREAPVESRMPENISAAENPTQPAEQSGEWVDVNPGSGETPQE